MASINDSSVRADKAWLGNILQMVIIGLLGWLLLETVENGRTTSSMVVVVSDVKDQVKDHETRIRVLEMEPRK